MESEIKQGPLYTRRAFLISAGIGSLGMYSLYRNGIELAKAAPEIFISASNSINGSQFISGFGYNGEQKFNINVDLRCHGVAVHPLKQNLAVIFARRPGNLAYLVNFEKGEIQSRILAEKGRHFFGHGSFSSDGRYLFSTENDVERGVGVVSIRDGDTLQELSSFDSNGIGPHELRILNDGKTLVVANGGILTHPSTGRKKLNIPTMSPSLSYFDLSTSRCLGDFTLSDSKLSIRHLSIASDDTVAVALQDATPEGRVSSLVAFHRGENNLVMASTPIEVSQQMNNYTGSICMDPSSGIAAVSSPRGDILTFWNSKKKCFVKSIRIDDCGGISFSPRRRSFVVTSGRGEIFFIESPSLEIESRYYGANTRWDNHIGLVS